MSPIKHHEAAGEAAEQTFASAFRLGAAGFVVIVFGCFLAGVGLWKLRLQGEVNEASPRTSPSIWCFCTVGTSLSSTRQ
jgi:hypothetical protein